MFRHAGCPPAVPRDSSREQLELNVNVGVDVDQDFLNSRGKILGHLPSHNLNVTTESFKTYFSNCSINDEGTDSKSREKSQKSRCRRLTETVCNGVRKRAASLKTRSSPPSVQSSRNPSQLNFGPIVIERIPTDPREFCLSPVSSRTTDLTHSTPTTTPASSPQSICTMAARQSTNLLDPAAAARRQQMNETKTRTHEMAVQEERAIRSRMREKGIEDQFPSYQFVDFIGKGTYGRVYLAHALAHTPPNEVAIKLINIDDVDYAANAAEREQSLADVRQEIKVLTQLKDYGVANVNLIHDVLEIDGFLWLVCEYCPGGSLRTLLRASNNRCEEKYVKAIARELAIGLLSIHEANIIHRDLKAANVMIHERGGLQIIDFGVAGMVESKIDKRGTIIGTPNWMPPEHHRGIATRTEIQYGFEVDVWSYIVTIYEVATGSPPHAGAPPQRLAAMLRTRPPRLSPDEYPKDLCEFVEFVAQLNPGDRPSVQAILDHSYIRNSETTHPTSMLKDLVDRFVNWTFSGGQRSSLFFPTGALAAADLTNTNDDDTVDFIFSTSKDLTTEYDYTYDPFAENHPEETGAPAHQHHSSTPSMSSSLDSLSSEPLDDYTSKPIKHVAQRSFDSDDPGVKRRIERGGQALGAIFNEAKEPYAYSTQSEDMPLDKPILSRAKSDLPLRDNNDKSDLARKELDFIESTSPRSGVELADADTIKQKRKQFPKEKRDTMGWQPDWGDMEANMNLDAEVIVDAEPSMPAVRPALMHAETAPDRITQARASTATMNLDDLLGDEDWVSGSAMGKSPGFATPIEEEDVTIRHNITDLTESAFPSYASSLADTSASEEDSLPTVLHRDGESMRGRKMSEHPNAYDDITAPAPTAMRDDADQELIAAELLRLLGGFGNELNALSDEFPHEEDIDAEFGDGGSEDGDVEDSDLPSGIEA